MSGSFGVGPNLYEDVRPKDNVTAVYVTADNAAVTDADFRYTSGEKLRIAVIKYVNQPPWNICYCQLLCFSSDERVYSDKLTIEIHQDDTTVTDGPPTNANFDPDTLERQLDHKKPDNNSFNNRKGKMPNHMSTLHLHA